VEVEVVHIQVTHHIMVLEVEVEVEEVWVVPELEELDMQRVVLERPVELLVPVVVPVLLVMLMPEVVEVEVEVDLHLMELLQTQERQNLSLDLEEQLEVVESLIKDIMPEEMVELEEELYILPPTPLQFPVPTESLLTVQVGAPDLQTMVEVEVVELEERSSWLGLL